MDYLYERRRRRKYRSPRDDDIEQEIIDRAMEIERSREKSLRRQFEYIVSNVKELERRRHRHRTQSPDYYRSSARDSSSDRYYQTNDSERRHRSSPKSKRSIPCQITMIYRGTGSERHGDEIMVLQENTIVFKGFLRARESFTFKFQQHPRRLIVKLEFFINELFECCLAIDCEQEQIEEDNELFQLQNLQISRRGEINEEQQVTKETERSNRSRRHQYSHTSSSSTVNEEKRSTDDHTRHQQRSKPLSTQVSKDRKTVSRETSHNKQRSQRSPSPPQSPPIKQTEKPKSNSTPAPPSVTRQSSSRPTSTTDRKPSALPRINSTNNDNDDEKRSKKQTSTTKPSYGPPQLSTFTRSSSESSVNEAPKVAKKEDEKPSTEVVTQSESPPAKKDDKEEEEEEEGEGGGASFVNFLQLLQAMSGGGGGGVRIPSSSDDGDGIQGLLTRLGIVTQNNAQKKTPNFAPHQVGNTENFLLVYLDSSPPEESNSIKFRGLVNSVKLFDDPDDCIAFINSISNERVILLVSDALGDPVVSRIQDLPQLFAIYVLCQTEEQADGWSSNQPKIRSINTDIDEILQQIKRDIENEENNSLTWTCSLANANLKKEPGFAIHQILKEVLLDADETSEAKKELVDFARIDYENNQEQLEYIRQFEENYRKENALDYFQQKQFLYKMLNRAFRIPEVDVLFKLRLFIQNLHQLIVASATDSSIKTIYRSHVMNNDGLETLKKCTNESLIGFSPFFLASTECPEGKSKTSSTDDQTEQNEKEGEEILFQIDVSNSNEYMSIDNQILVTFGLVTRFGSIEKDRNGRTIVHLSTLNKDDRRVEQLIEPIRKETRAPHPSIRLVKLFIEIDQYSQAFHLGQFLIADSPTAKKDPLLALARTYHSLGTTLYEKEDYDQALDVIKKSHELYLRFLPEDAPQLSPTWNNMGSIYLRQGKTDLALEHHERALAIQLKSPSPDLASIISYSNNIGGVYLKLERYDDALIHFKRALQIEEQTLPPNHPELAGTYHRIGGVYFRQNNHEKALEYYDKTLEIELASLPDNHPTVAVTYHNRGTAFEGLGKLEEAVESAEKAVERLLKTLPKEHPQVRMNQAYADRLKQKLWVKQLFNSET